MAKYLVVGMVDATVSTHIEADSPEEAMEKAGDEMSAGVCHQCADHLEVGDVVSMMVIDRDGGGDVVLDDSPVTLSSATVEQLEAELASRRPKNRAARSPREMGG